MHFTEFKHVSFILNPEVFVDKKHFFMELLIIMGYMVNVNQFESLSLEELKNTTRN